MFWSAVVPPLPNVFETFRIETAAARRSCDVLRRPPHDEPLDDRDDAEEEDPEGGGDDVRRPERRGVERVVLGEVEDRAAEPVLDRRRQLADDRADDARRRGDLERREDVGQRARELDAPERAPLARRRRSASARACAGSVESRPRRVLIATGKNVRKALITATGIHTGRPLPPSQITTIGAIARIGTVCEPTTYGWKPRRSRFEKWKTTPIAMPTIAPISEPGGGLPRREERLLEEQLGERRLLRRGRLPEPADDVLQRAASRTRRP